MSALEETAISESWSGRIDDIKSRIKDAVGATEGEIDVDTVMTRIRESVGKVGSDVDADALVARVKDAVGKAEGKVDAEKIRQWIDEVDRDKLKGWLDEARSKTASAATLVETRGERLADRAPGAFDTVLGVAKEKIGGLTGNEDLAREGELQHLKGDIEERFASAADTVEEEAKDATDAVKAKLAGTTD